VITGRCRSGQAWERGWVVRAVDGGEERRGKVTLQDERGGKGERVVWSHIAGGCGAPADRRGPEEHSVIVRLEGARDPGKEGPIVKAIDNSLAIGESAAPVGH
jgi:hypothetical protein